MNDDDEPIQADDPIRWALDNPKQFEIEARGALRPGCRLPDPRVCAALGSALGRRVRPTVTGMFVALVDMATGVRCGSPKQSALLITSLIIGYRKLAAENARLVEENAEWRRCPAVHPHEGQRCIRERDHDEDHVAAVAMPED